MPKLTVTEYRKLRNISEQRVYQLIRQDKVIYTKEFIKPTILIHVSDSEYKKLKKKV